MVSATWKRIFISVQMDLKSSHSFNDGNSISLNRDVDNFDKKYVRPVNGIVINSEIIPIGADVLIHHNAVHDTYRVFDYKELSGDFIASNLRYFSIPETECYAWRIGGSEWTPTNGFEFGLRVFKPYKGSLSGILPTQIKNKLYITTGEFKGKVAMTKGASDYEMIYQDRDGKENRLIRLRHFKEPENIREEIIGVDNACTLRVESGEYLIGLSPTRIVHVEQYLKL